MNNTPMVSVIIPVYNVAPYLGEALDSVIYQTYTNLEILFADDDSTDGSGPMAEYIRYSCKHPEDLQGRNTLREMLVKAREETGLKHCSLPARLGYYPVLLCPRLCMPLYDSYRVVRTLRKVIHSLSIGSV